MMKMVYMIIRIKDHLLSKVALEVSSSKNAVVHS